MYNRLGRAAIRFSLAYLRRRYKRQIRVGIGVAAVAGIAAGAAYLAATRNVPEG
ncbi:MAG TPA: hypothetical protein VIT85_07365 [Solirubrobacterales bacterium]